MPSPDRDRHGLGDPRIPWNVLLSTSTVAPDRPVARKRLDDLAASMGWPALELCTSPTTEDALRTLAAERTPSPVTACHTPEGLVLRVSHQDVDGLGALAVLSAVLDQPAQSAARGVDAERPTGSMARTVASRLVEVLVRPPTRVAPDRQAASPLASDAFAVRTVDATLRTAALVHAAAQAVASWNVEHGHGARRISVAVGVTTAADSREVGDHSGFLRLRGVEQMSRADVSAALLSAPLQRGGRTDDTGRLLAATVRTATRLAADRLGSTLLVSHLGTVTAPGIADLTFYPVTGGSGLALGAVTTAGRTTLSLRSRANRHDTRSLRRILETLVTVLEPIEPGSPGESR